MSDAIYQKNLRALAHIFAPMAAYMESIDSFSAHKLETPDGGHSLRAKGEEGPWIHSRRAPKREVERIVAGVEVEPAQVIVLLGVGTGELPYRLSERFPENRIVVLEPNGALTKTFLESYEIGEWLVNGRIYIARELEHGPLSDQLSDVGEGILRHGYVMVEHTYCHQLEEYSEVVKEFALWAQKESANLRSKMFGTRDGLTNLLLNAPVYAMSNGVAEVANTLKGIPAVLVGAGPSLERNLHVLKELQDRCFILAVSTSLKRLLADGIRVDATAVVDWSHLSARYFEGIEANNIPIFAQPRAHPSTLAAWRGPILMNDDENIRGIFRGRLDAKGFFEGEANNVGHFAYNNLVGIGASKLIFIGMDLGYSFHVTHASRTTGQDDWLGSAHRFMSLDTQEALLCGYAGTTHVREDAYGHQIAADTQMDHAARTFEDLIHRTSDCEVINCTEGGQRIKGAENKSLREVLEACPPLGDRLDLFRNSIQTHARGPLLEKALMTLEDAKEYSEALGALYQDAQKVLKSALNRVKRGKVPIGAEEAIQKIGKKVQEWSGIYDCASAFCPSDFHIRNQRKEAVEAAGLDEMKELKERAIIEIDFLKALKDSLQTWMAILDGGIDSTHKAIEREAKHV